MFDSILMFINLVPIHDNFINENRDKANQTLIYACENELRNSKINYILMLFLF